MDSLACVLVNCIWSVNQCLYVYSTVSLEINVFLIFLFPFTLLGDSIMTRNINIVLWLCS